MRYVPRLNYRGSILVNGPGYDGNIETIEAVRDLAGKGKRDIVRRIRYDVIEKLYKLGLIEEYQRDAAVRLQCDWQLSEIIVQTRTGQPGTARHDFGLSDARLDAQARHGAAMRLWDGQRRAYVEAVVLANTSHRSAAKSLRIPAYLALPILVQCLKELASHYEWSGA